MRASSHTQRRRATRLGQIAVVNRPALRLVLLELQDVRAAQGVESRWIRSLHPSLARELEAAIADEQAAA